MGIGRWIGFPRIVLGYHGCTAEFAEAILRGEVAIRDWLPSMNPYDWLGHGIYFWEYAPERARAWEEGDAIGAMIQLGRCLDPTDIRYTDLLLPGVRCSEEGIPTAEEQTTKESGETSRSGLLGHKQLNPRATGRRAVSDGALSVFGRKTCDSRFTRAPRVAPSARWSGIRTVS